MTDIFWNMEMPFVWTLLDVEENGMHVNSGAVSALRSELEQERDIHLTRWNELTGGRINYNSPKQLGELLFKQLRLPKQGKSKSAGSFAGACKSNHTRRTENDNRVPLNYLDMDRRKCVLISNTSLLPNQQ